MLSLIIAIVVSVVLGFAWFVIARFATPKELPLTSGSPVSIIPAGGVPKPEVWQLDLAGVCTACKHMASAHKVHGCQVALKPGYTCACGLSMQQAAEQKYYAEYRKQQIIDDVKVRELNAKIELLEEAVHKINHPQDAPIDTYNLRK